MAHKALGTRVDARGRRDILAHGTREVNTRETYTLVQLSSVLIRASVRTPLVFRVHADFRLKVYKGFLNPIPY